MRNLANRLILVVVIALVATTHCFAQKPKWVGNTPKELNHTYKFVEIVSQGSTLESARSMAIANLKTNDTMQEGIRVQRNTKETITRDKNTENNRLQVSKKDHIVEEIVIDGEPFRLQAQRVDEYITRSNGYYVVHTLFAAATTENPVFDHAYLTTSYGAAPIFMSIIPGLGQIYKGSTLKGIALFAGTAACAGGALICENLRSDYKNKMREQPQFAQKYNTKANNCQTARNICLGAAAAVWLYNIIDAAAAKGARKVEVRRGGRVSTAFAPMITPDGAGLTLAVNF